MPRACREFAKGGVVKGGFAIMVNMYYLCLFVSFMCLINACLRFCCLALVLLLLSVLFFFLLLLSLVSLSSLLLSPTPVGSSQRGGLVKEGV